MNGTQLTHISTALRILEEAIRLTRDNDRLRYLMDLKNQLLDRGVEIIQASLDEDREDG